MSPNRRSFLLGLTSLPLTAALRAEPQSSASPSESLITAAREQIGMTIGYDGAYRSLNYPNGDVPLRTGVCTDVVIRAYRLGFGFDLQSAVHEDMRRNFSAYPQIWNLTRTDTNIDHRRVPNLETFFTRKAAKLDLPTDLSTLSAGDLLTMRLPQNLPHIAIVSDKTTLSGQPYIIHNIGVGTCEDPLSLHSLQDMLHTRFRYLDDLPI